MLQTNTELHQSAISSLHTDLSFCFLRGDVLHQQYNTSAFSSAIKRNMSKCRTLWRDIYINKKKCTDETHYVHRLRVRAATSENICGCNLATLNFIIKLTLQRRCQSINQEWNRGMKFRYEKMGPLLSSLVMQIIRRSVRCSSDDITSYFSAVRWPC